MFESLVRNISIPTKQRCKPYAAQPCLLNKYKQSSPRQSQQDLPSLRSLDRQQQRPLDPAYLLAWPSCLSAWSPITSGTLRGTMIYAKHTRTAVISISHHSRNGGGQESSNRYPPQLFMTLHRRTPVCVYPGLFIPSRQHTHDDVKCRGRGNSLTNHNARRAGLTSSGDEGSKHAAHRFAAGLPQDPEMPCFGLLV